MKGKASLNKERMAGTLPRTKLKVIFEGGFPLIFWVACLEREIREKM